MITSVPLSAWLVLPSSVDSPVSFVVLGLRVVMSSNFLLFESIVAVTSKRWYSVAEKCGGTSSYFKYLFFHLSITKYRLMMKSERLCKREVEGEVEGEVEVKR